MDNFVTFIRGRLYKLVFGEDYRIRKISWLDWLEVAVMWLLVPVAVMIALLIVVLLVVGAFLAYR